MGLAVFLLHRFSGIPANSVFLGCALEVYLWVYGIYDIMI